MVPDRPSIPSQKRRQCGTRKIHTNASFSFTHRLVLLGGANTSVSHGVMCAGIIVGGEIGGIVCSGNISDCGVAFAFSCFKPYLLNI